MNDGNELKKKESKTIRAQKLLHEILQYFIYFQICISYPNIKKNQFYIIRRSSLMSIYFLFNVI